MVQAKQEINQAEGAVITYRRVNKMSSEEREGYEAYWKGQTKGSNPYHWSNETWWMVEDWDKGWGEAQNEDYDDD
ncbi:MAG: hypothetical protein ACI9O6_000918 [Glaciecola sp.]|jgi:hypothetical protein